MVINFRDSTPLYQQIVQHIRAQILAGDVQVGDKVPTQHEMAKAYDVSLITVKKALAELTREGILFSRVGKGTYVAQKPINSKFSKTLTFGLVLRDFDSPYFSQIVRSVEASMRVKEGHLLLSTSSNKEENEDKEIARYRDLGVHGLIIASMTRSYKASRALKQLHNDRFPYVVVSYISDEDINYIGTDHEYGAFLATNHLLAIGYDKIGYINGEKGNLLGEVRKGGFLKALKQHGKVFDEQCEFFLDLRGEWHDYESGYGIGKRFLELSDPPSAMFIYNDLAALGFQKAILDAGLRIPQDVAIVGFDNIKQGITTAVPLSTIHQPTEEIGQMAVDMLYKTLRGESTENRVILKPRLVVRESCGSQIIER